MRLLSCILLFSTLFLTHNANARTWYIQADGTGDAPTIQAGIDSATSGDVVELADGQYEGVGNGNLDFQGKDIILRSESGVTESCVLYGNSSPYFRAFDFHSGEPPEAVVEGIKIRGFGGGGYNEGAGILCRNGSSPTIRNCWIGPNEAWFGSGGGMAIIEGSAPRIIGCVFYRNYAYRFGGGVYCSWASPRFDDCRFDNNSCVSAGDHGDYSGWGGGLYAVSSVLTLVRCEFLGNRSVYGAGLAIGPGCTPDLTDVVFRHNWGNPAYGAGLWTMNLNHEFRGLLFDGNNASRGGAIASYTSSLTFTGCTFIGNSAWNSGSLLYSVASNRTTFTKCLVVTDSDRSETVDCGGGARVEVTCTNVWRSTGTNGWDGCLVGMEGVDGNFSADPEFCDRSTWDYRLKRNSPCLAGGHPDGDADCGMIGAFGRAGFADCRTVERAKTVESAGSAPNLTGSLQVYPTPAKAQVMLSYSAKNSDLVVEVYDIAGRLVRSWQPAGFRGSVIWDRTNRHGEVVAAGVYFARLIDGDEVMTVRMTLVR